MRIEFEFWGYCHGIGSLGFVDTKRRKGRKSNRIGGKRYGDQNQFDNENSSNYVILRLQSSLDTTNLDSIRNSRWYVIKNNSQIATTSHNRERSLLVPLEGLLPAHLKQCIRILKSA